MILPIILATSLIRNLKYIVPLSIIANISLFAAIVLILRHTVIDLGPITERTFVGHWQDLSLCFGGVVFAVEGITMVIEIQ